MRNSQQDSQTLPGLVAPWQQMLPAHLPVLTCPCPAQGVGPEAPLSLALAQDSSIGGEKWKVKLIPCKQPSYIQHLGGNHVLSFIKL